jgi:hypothetical protein
LYFDNISRVRINGAHHVIERCRFRGINRKTVRPIAATDVRITRCDFCGYADGDTPKSCINFDPNGFDDGTNVRCRIDHCYFHDINPMGSGHLEVGAYWSSGTQKLPAKGNNLYDNIRDSGGNAYTIDAAWAQGTTFSVDNEPYSAAVKLTSHQVGLDAADPLVPPGWK